MAQLFAALLQLKRQEWSCAPAPFDSQASPEVELAVDAWCLVFARDPMTEELPPAEVQPWLLARLLCAQLLCQQLHDQADLDCPPAGASSTAQLLIGEWHGCWKQRWASLSLPGWLH